MNIALQFRDQENDIINRQDSTIPGERDAADRVGYIEFEVKAGDAGEKLRVPLLATHCFGLYL